MVNIETEARRFLKNVRHLSRFVKHAQIGAEIIQLMDQFTTLMAHSDEDGAVSITAASSQTNKRKVAVRHDLLAALESINGREKMKTCCTCGESKPLGAFSLKKSSPDGRNVACLECERQRVKDHLKKKRELAQQAGLTLSSSPSETGMKHAIGHEIAHLSAAHQPNYPSGPFQRVLASSESVAVVHENLEDAPESKPTS